MALEGKRAREQGKLEGERTKKLSQSKGFIIFLYDAASGTVQFLV